MLQFGDIAIFPKEVKEPIVPLFAYVIQGSLIGFIDLDESNSISEEMCENHDFTFSSDSAVACWISNTVEISMCNSDIKN